jgi:hypothetical protein
MTKPGLDYENEKFYNERRSVPFPSRVNRMKKRLLEEVENDLKEKKLE